MPSIHRTARGASVDIEQIRLSNEEAVAVGNHRVNARGDMLDASGKVTMTRDEVMAKHYNNTNKTFNIPVDQPVVESSTHARSMQRVQADVIDAQKLQDTIAKLTQQLAEKDAQLGQQTAAVTVADEAESEVTYETPNLRGGLAAAIAKNKEYLESKKKSQ
jgi:hypothetical protein